MSSYSLIVTVVVDVIHQLVLLEPLILEFDIHLPHYQLACSLEVVFFLIEDVAISNIGTELAFKGLSHTK